MTINKEKQEIVGKKKVNKVPASRPTTGSKLNKLGTMRYTSMSLEEQAKLGKNAKDIAFLNLLGNPYSIVPRGTDKGSESVGLLLKNVSNHEIRVSQLKQVSSEVMDADFSNITEEIVKPGETFQVTWVEAGLLANQPEYNGYFTGDPEKMIRYSPSSPKGKSLPTTKFMMHKNKGENKVHRSIADYTLDIATEEEKAKRRVSPRFAKKFNIFSIKQRHHRVPVSKSEGREKVNMTSIASLEMYKKKIAESQSDSQLEDKSGKLDTIEKPKV